MMTNDERQKTIDWLKEFVNRMKDRDDYEVLHEHIDRLEQSIRELEERGHAL